MSRLAARLVDVLYAGLLWLYPRSLRRKHGREMRQFGCAELRRRGWRGAARLGADLMVSLPAEWLRTMWRARAGTPAPRGGPMHGVGRDVSYALRLLWRSPAFTIAAVLTLALGIGANTAIFSLADATLLRPLRVARPAELYALERSSAYPDYLAYAERQDLFGGLIATSGGRVNLVAGGRAAMVDASFVSGNYFGVLGVPPAVGRVFGAADDQRHGPLVGVLGYRWWQTRFGGDPGVTGRTVRANGAPVTIVGVAAKDFHGIRPSDTTAIFFPLTATPRVLTGFFSQPRILDMRGMQWLTVVARLKPDVTPAAAAAALETLYRHGHPEEPASKANPIVFNPLRLRALGKDNAARVYRFVGLLAVVVALALLIGCANLGNLFLSRASARRREIGVRLAIGAGRARIARQLLIESVVLSLIGGGAGLLVASATLGALARFQLPGGIDIDALDLRLNDMALAFTGLVACGTGVLFGLAPAWRAASLDVVGSLRNESRATSGRSRLRSTLVAAQVALSLVLLVGTGLFVRSLVHVLDVPLGFRVDGVATASVNLGTARYDVARAKTFYDEALARVRRLPGVTAAAWSTLIPINGSRVFTATVDGYRARQDEEVYFYYSAVGPEYFQAAGTRLLRGRVFSATDAAGAPPVGVINETAARTYWPGRDPVGGRISAGDGPWTTVVGIVEDAKVDALDEAPVPYVYLPFAQDGNGGTREAAHLFVRTSGQAQALLGPIGEQLRSVDRDAPVYDVSTLAWRVRELVMPQRMGTMLFAFFSLLALTLAAVGIYGVASYVAALRTREIAIRIALGAGRGEIRRLVLLQGSAPVAAGLAAGIALAVAGGRFAGSFLYGVSAHDPLTIVTVALGLGAVAILAAWIPARRAAGLDPMRALRQE